MKDISGRGSREDMSVSNLVFSCSPHPEGSTDRAAYLVAKAWEVAGFSPQIIRLRDYRIQGCTGCGECARTGGCVFSAEDDCRELFERIRESNRLCFCAPIYFYHLPALFKAFIDRSQSIYTDTSGYWKSGAKEKPRALSVLLAARERGRSLFAGSELTLKYFLFSFGRELSQIGLYGVESKADLEDEPGKNVYKIKKHVLDAG